jgi:transposase
MLLDQDESWFSRFKQPKMHTFSEKDAPLRLVERQPKPDESDKAIACFGAVCHETAERFFYFADGQPNSEKTILMLQALIAVAQSRSKRVLVIIWDRATWHKSKRLKSWVYSHNRQAKREPGAVRLLLCLLPSKSPWLNPMEPIWLHVKRKISEPDGDLSVKVLKQRLCAVFNTTLQHASLQLSA